MIELGKRGEQHKPNHAGYLVARQDHQLIALIVDSKTTPSKALPYNQSIEILLYVTQDVASKQGQ
jgi:hypothetical protein